MRIWIARLLNTAVWLMMVFIRFWRIGYADCIEMGICFA